MSVPHTQEVRTYHLFPIPFLPVKHPVFLNSHVAHARPWRRTTTYTGPTSASRTCAVVYIKGHVSSVFQASRSCFAISVRRRDVDGKGLLWRASSIFPVLGLFYCLFSFSSCNAIPVGATRGGRRVTGLETCLVHFQHLQFSNHARTTWRQDPLRNHACS